MEILLALTLPLIILACVAYYFFAPGPESEFSKKFSLDNVLRKTLPPEIDFPANGNSPVWVCLCTDGTRQKTFPIYIQVNQNGGVRFNKDGALKSIELEIEKEIKANGASLISKDSSISNRIDIMYESEKIRGHISVSGKWESGFYLMTADLEERPKRWRFANKSEGLEEQRENACDSSGRL
jgi:hypothetical protein